jgi:hypothetical protein
VPTSDTIEWSITSPNGASAVLIGGTLVDSHRVTWPSVQLPFRLSTTAPHGTTTRLVLSVSVFAQDAATCSIVVNGSAGASASTSSYRTPAVCQWG